MMSKIYFVFVNIVVKLLKSKKNSVLFLCMLGLIV